MIVRFMPVSKPVSTNRDEPLLLMTSARRLFASHFLMVRRVPNLQLERLMLILPVREIDTTTFSRRRVGSLTGSMVFLQGGLQNRIIGGGDCQGL